MNFCEDLPEPPSSIYALEGTRKHEELEFSLDVPGLRRPDEPDVDMCLEYIYSFNPDYLESEQKVELFDETGGTLDLYFVALGDHHIFDAKFGFDPVNVLGNIQLSIYAAARLASVPREGKVFLHIGQPLAFHADGPFRAWETSFEELDVFVDWLRDRVAATNNPAAALTPGKHCKYCPGEAVCPAREKQALAVASEAFAGYRDVDVTVLPLPKDLSIERLGLILDGKDALEGWLNAIEDHAKFLAAQGFKVPGRKLVATQSRRKWKGKPLDVARELARLSGRPMVEFLDLVSITEVEKKIPKENREHFAFLTDKQPSGNLTLVADSDKREAKSATRNAFDGVILEGVESQTEIPAPLWPGMTYATYESENS